MEFADTDAKITAELDALRAREASLREQLSEVEGQIAGLEAQREEAAAVRDATTGTVAGSQKGIALSSAQVCAPRPP
eukprot:COSAG05_NODE_1769_length_4114_cov_2.830137_4_plen_77_part_00